MCKKLMMIPMVWSLFLASINAFQASNSKHLMLLAETALAVAEDKEESSSSVPNPLKIRASKTKPDVLQAWNTFVQNLVPFDDPNSAQPGAERFYPWMNCPVESARRYVLVGGDTQQTMGRGSFNKRFLRDQVITINGKFAHDCIANLEDKISSYCYEHFPSTNPATINNAVHIAFQDVRADWVAAIIRHESTGTEEIIEKLPALSLVPATENLKAAMKTLCGKKSVTCWKFVIPSMQYVQRMMLSVMKITLFDSNEHVAGLKKALMSSALDETEKKTIVNVYSNLPLAKCKIHINFPRA